MIFNFQLFFSSVCMSTFYSLKKFPIEIGHFHRKYSIFLIVYYIQANLDQLKLMGPVILNGILKLLDGYSNSDSGWQCS